MLFRLNTMAFYSSAFVLIFLIKSSHGLSTEDNQTRNSLKQYDTISNLNNGRDYRLMYNSQNWSDAAEACATSGGSLAVPRSQMEFDFLQEIVKGMYYPAVVGTDDKLVVWLGISYCGGAWKTELGEDIETLPFHTWALGNGQTSEDPREPQCVVIDAANSGLRDYWCYKKQPFICEFPGTIRI